MDLMFLERINDRLNELDIATVEGNQVARYRLLFTIFMDTHFKYVERSDELKSMFKAVKETLSSQVGGSSKHMMMQQQKVLFSEAEELLDDIQFMIVRILFETGIIYLKKRKNLPPEEEIYGDY